MNFPSAKTNLKQILEKDSNFSKHLLLSVSHEVLADLETPVSTFYKLCENKPYSFLLESVEGGEKLGRYSFIGTEPLLIFTNKDNKTHLENKIENKTIELESNPFIALKDLLTKLEVLDNNLNPFLGFVGHFSYENIRWIEPKIKLNLHKDIPDVCLMLVEKLVIFDHIQHKVTLIINSILKDKSEISKKETKAKEKLSLFINEFNKPKTYTALSLNFENENQTQYSSNFKKDEFINKVKKIKEYIYHGDIFQAVISQKLTVKESLNGLLLYRALRSINPSPYLFYLKYQDFQIAGSSPEVMVKCEKRNSKKVASLRPIAGTYPRGKDKEEDQKNITKLLNDPKERAEHLMLVDLARNDLGRVCEAGSITVSELMVIEKYSHVLHMVSQAEGILQKDKTSIDLLQATFPAGTLSGAPKVRAMEIINEIENDPRGPYGGCIGFFGLNNTINTCMTIRTFIIYKDKLEIQAGAGIVADSDPENEYEETLRKGAALLKAISFLN